MEERYAFEELEDEAAMSAEPAEAPSEPQMAITPAWRTFADIPDVRVIKRPEPGRNHKLWVSFGQVKVRACKDTGAASTTIPESLALRVIRHHASMTDSEVCPVIDVFEYKPSIRLVGFASSAPVEIN